MRVYNSILETIGNTPLVKIGSLNTGYAQVFAKLEYFNPLSCVKERIALEMIEEGEKKGTITKGTVIIEPTSGNTGIGLAMVCAVKGYRLILTMPDSFSIERRKLLKILGAHIVLTEGAAGMSGAIEKANKLHSEMKNSVILQQFENPANPSAHEKTTGPEIWNDTDGKIDIMVAGVGTGGTITGSAKYLKEKNPSIKIIAVEPMESRVLSGGAHHPHRIQGIGAGFMPKVFDQNLIDEIIPVIDTDAAETVKLAAKKEGILCGISGGAALWSAIEISKRPENADKIISVIIPDSGERYLSTWLFEE
ncbi:MAG TPA: cysteine synthase A [Spirochaetota bacterium]|nr:cysteine synthase A [Spirochaetota bacterium]